MAIYTFKCPACAREEEIWGDRPNSPVCKCGSPLERDYQADGFSFNFTFREGYHAGLGEYITSKKHLERRMRETNSGKRG